MKQNTSKVIMVLTCTLLMSVVAPARTFAVQAIAGNGVGSSPDTSTYSLGPVTAPHQCGSSLDGQKPINTSIDFGCVGRGNALMDLTFAIIRFLSDGVGLIIIGSLVWAGIQYSGSRGDPQSTASAVNRIQSTFFALLLFIFAYAILNYIIPGQVLK